MNLLIKQEEKVDKQTGFKREFFFLAHYFPASADTELQRYTLYEYEPGGEFEVVAPVVPGDPWGMDVSPDGQWLTVIEVGAVDKIPLSAP